MHSFIAMSVLMTSLFQISRGQFPPPTPALTAFNASIGGRLAFGIPWPEPCFSSYNGVAVTPNSTACAFVQQNFFNNHQVRSEQFGAYSALQYEACMSNGDECALDWTNAAGNTAAFAPPADCKQGSVPPYYLDVQSTSDVQKTLAFVKSVGMTLVIKNTGHDFKGRSAAPNSLALWMHHLKTMTLVKKFVADGCHSPGVTGITLAAGVQFAELFKFADDNGLEIVGGTDQTVGAVGGFLQGGGHSSITPSAGMAVDRVLQYKIVTTDGVLRTANACQNSDLFFALRGGGGGTFGVVMEATILATPNRNYQIASINWPVNNDNLKQVVAMFVDNATALATQGWGGYLTPSTGSLVITNPNLNTADAQKSVQTLLDLSTSLGGTSSVTQVGSFFQWFTLFVNNQLTVQQDAVGLPNALSSRLIPQANHATAASRAQLVDALMNAFSNTVFSQIHFTTPFGFKGTNGVDTSINPIWRTSLYQVILVNTWFVHSTLADRQGAYAASTTAANFLRSITPNSGAYHNEADIHEPNFQAAFWGTGLYNKLLGIKNKYDPGHVLDCWNCIGWKGASAPQYKCYI